MQSDFLEFINELIKRDVDFVIIGGIALAFYGHPRYTGDLDIWIYPSSQNIEHTFLAIESFFDTELSIAPQDFLSKNHMITLGQEPVQIQLLVTLDGVTIDEIWENKISGTFGNLKVFYLGKKTFIKNKKTVGRSQDLVDIEKLMND